MELNVFRLDRVAVVGRDSVAVIISRVKSLVAEQIRCSCCSAILSELENSAFPWEATPNNEALSESGTVASGAKGDWDLDDGDLCLCSERDSLLMDTLLSRLDIA